MQNTTIDIKLIDNVSGDEDFSAAFIQLYREAGWLELAGDLEELSWISRLVAGSFCFVGAYHGRRLIGMGRSISDGASDAYIQDVTVLRDYRRHGIGSRIIETIITHLQEHGIDWIGLIAEPGADTVYRRLGFSEMPGGGTPMLLNTL